MEHYEATAFAIIVFPFPGGPNSSIPLTGSLKPVKNYGFWIGKIIV